MVQDRRSHIFSHQSRICTMRTETYERFFSLRNELMEALAMAICIESPFATGRQPGFMVARVELCVDGAVRVQNVEVVGTYIERKNDDANLVQDQVPIVVVAMGRDVWSTGWTAGGSSHLAEARFEQASGQASDCIRVVTTLEEEHSNSMP